MQMPRHSHLKMSYRTWFWKNTKNRVLEHLFNNKTIASSISNSSIPVSIVVGVISPNGTQVSGYGTFPNPIIQPLMEIQYST